MSEHELSFLETLKETYDTKYHRMQTFLLAILGTFLAGFIIIGASQMSKLSDTSAKMKALEDMQLGTGKDITYILENSVSKKAIDRIIQTMDMHTKVMIEFYPDNIKEGMEQYRKESNALRNDIMKYNSDLTTRGVGNNGSMNIK